MKKRRIKIRPLPPELASAARRKALFASLIREGDTPLLFSQNNACPALKPNAMRALCRKIADDADGQGRVGVAAALPVHQPEETADGRGRVGVAATLPVRHKKSVGVAAALPVHQPEETAGGQSRVGVAAALPARQQKRGAPKGNRNALRHGAFTAERLAARARGRRILADTHWAIIRALSLLGQES